MIFPFKNFQNSKKPTKIQKVTNIVMILRKTLKIPKTARKSPISQNSPKKSQKLHRVQRNRNNLAWQFLQRFSPFLYMRKLLIVLSGNCWNVITRSIIFPETSLLKRYYKICDFFFEKLSLKSGFYGPKMDPKWRRVQILLSRELPRTFAIVTNASFSDILR